MIVVREDKNGTKASATYTPTVTPVKPTAEDATSTDKQGQEQTGKPNLTEGNPRYQWMMMFQQHLKMDQQLRQPR